MIKEITNREWLNTLSDEEFAKVIDTVAYCRDEYCKGEYTCLTENCYKCCMKWLKEKHKMKMPELKAGMFIDYKGWSEVNEQECVKTGVIVPSSINQLRVVNSNGDWAWLNDVIGEVVAVYDDNVYCFDETGCIKGMYKWKKEE